MYRVVKPFFMMVETPLHMGSGEELGIVDMPIQRERHTNFPKLEASGLKGSIRRCFEDNHDRIKVGSKVIDDDEKRKHLVNLCFGPEPESTGSEHAGALAFTDGRLLLFPVKSMKGVFAWITSPQVINRLVTDLNLAGLEAELPSVPNGETAPETCDLFVEKDDDKVVLEEYTFSIKKDKTATEFAQWLSEKVIPQNSEYNYWREKIKNDLVVLPDETYSDFVTNSTEVITRTRIDPETGTVAEGGLFTEEYLPCDSIVYSLAMASPLLVDEDTDKKVFNQENSKKEEELVMEYFANGLSPVIQLGGNATIGKGLVRNRIWQEEDGNE